MRIVRRTAFAAPLVVVGCASPALPTPQPPVVAPPGDVSVPPPPRMDVTSWPPPHLPRVQDPPPVATWPIAEVIADRGGSRVTISYVDSRQTIWKILVHGSACRVVAYESKTVACHSEWLPESVTEQTADILAPPPIEPLGKKESLYEVCSHSFCNPPPPAARRTLPSQKTNAKPLRMLAEGAWTRVRIQKFDDLQDTSWHAALLDADNKELPNGACLITDWDGDELECVTGLPPGDYRVEVRPPTRFDQRIPFELDGKFVRVRRPWRRDEPHTPIKMVLEIAGETCALQGDRCELPHPPAADATAIWYREHNRPQDDPYEVPLVRLSVENGATRAEFARGATNGLAVGMPVDLRTADDKIEDRCTLDRVDAQHASCLITSTHDQMRPVAHAIVLR